MITDEGLPKCAIDIGKNIAEDIIRPTSKSIGDNIGLLVDGVMGWLGYLGEKQKIKREVYLDDYKKRIEHKILDIPRENLVEPPIRIIGPAIEASKFFIEEETCREMFAKLIASSCNVSTKNTAHPAFPDIIKQLSVTDGNFLLNYKLHSTLPCVELYKKHADGKITPYIPLLFDFKGSSCTQNEDYRLKETVDNLKRLGLIVLNQKVIELDYNYDKFKDYRLYKDISSNIKKNSTINMIKYRLELTSFGKGFVECCL